jgi:hypothetical protein
MIFDTDILVWIQRGNTKASDIFSEQSNRNLSILSYMELIQCAKDKNQVKMIGKLVRDYSVNVLPLTENIGHRALIYIEEYGISSGLRAGDAIIASTAVENNLPLLSGNSKHFRFIKELDLRIFRP